MIYKENIKQLVKKKLEGTEQFLVDIKMSPNCIAVYIDKPSGITIEECVSLSKQLSEELGSTGLFETHELEVSSPGMDQPLKVYKQYLRRLGKEIKVITTAGIEYRGKLLKAEETGIQMLESKTLKENNRKRKIEETVSLPFDEIKETTLMFNF